MASLPEPRRVIAAHHPDGTPNVIDEVVPTTDAGSGFRVAQLFAQTEYEISNPTSVADKGKDGTPHSKVAGGVAARFVGRVSSTRSQPYMEEIQANEHIRYPAQD